MAEDQEQKTHELPADFAAMLKALADDFGDQASISMTAHGPEIRVKPTRVYDIAVFLKNRSPKKYDYLRNLTAVDWRDRFEMVYNFGNLTRVDDITVKADIDRDEPSVDSITPIWAGADWQEREIFDLFGIEFRFHPDLRRIMLPDEWVGHPLRKDYVIKEQEVENWRQAPGQKNSR